MTCLDFEHWLGDLVCDRLSNATTRKQALTHAITCQACGKQLAEQRELNLRLFEFAEATRHEHPSLRIKQQLRGALADLQVAPPMNASVRTGFKFSWFPNWQMVVFAVTAALLLFSMSLVWQRHNEPSQKTTVAGMANKESATAEILLPHLPISQPQHSAVAQPVTKYHVTRHKQWRTSPSTKSEQGFAFVPLTLGTDERALANGMLVRLEVPRAQLIALGLPIGIEADRETVNAEVMIGEDGVAYAIRVLQ